MIKAIAYAAILLVMILTGLNLAVSHALATDGERLAKLGGQSRQIQEEADGLRRDITEAQSVSSILFRAENLGFTGLAKQKVISFQHLADSVNVRLGQ